MSDQPENPPPFEIQLEPIPLADDASPTVRHGMLDTMSPSETNFPPVPDLYSHLCPDCGYDLRGLRSRVCPECGQPFLVAEARAAGRDAAPLNADDRLAIRINRICWWVGIGSYGLFIILPAFVKGSSWGLFMSGAAFLMLCGCTIYKVTFDRTWAEALFFFFLLFATFGGIAMYVL